MRTRIATKREGAIYVPAYSVNNTGDYARRFEVMNRPVRTFRDVVREWMQA